MEHESLKLTAYFGERQRTGDQFLAETMLDLYEERQIATSVMLRGIAGFGLAPPPAHRPVVVIVRRPAGRRHRGRYQVDHRKPARSRVGR